MQLIVPTTTQSRLISLHCIHVVVQRLGTSKISTIEIIPFGVHVAPLYMYTFRSPKAYLHGGGGEHPQPPLSNQS